MCLRTPRSASRPASSTPRHEPRIAAVVDEGGPHGPPFVLRLEGGEPHGGRDWPALEQVAVQPPCESRRVLVGDLPERRDDGLGAGGEKRPLQAAHPLAA